MGKPKSAFTEYHVQQARLPANRRRRAFRFGLTIYFIALQFPIERVHADTVVYATVSAHEKTTTIETEQTIHIFLNTLPPPVPGTRIFFSTDIYEFYGLM